MSQDQCAARRLLDVVLPEGSDRAPALQKARPLLCRSRRRARPCQNARCCCSRTRRRVLRQRHPYLKVVARRQWLRKAKILSHGVASFYGRSSSRERAASRTRASTSSVKAVSRALRLRFGASATRARKQASLTNALASF